MFVCFFVNKSSLLICVFFVLVICRFLVFIYFLGYLKGPPGVDLNFNMHLVFLSTFQRSFVFVLFCLCRIGVLWTLDIYLPAP